MSQGWPADAQPDTSTSLPAADNPAEIEHELEVVQRELAHIETELSTLGVDIEPTETWAVDPGFEYPGYGPDDPVPGLGQSDGDGEGAADTDRGRDL